MPFAVTHMLIPIILVDLFRDHILNKKGIITNKHVLMAGIGGLLPDIDLPISYLFLNGVNVHRLFTHNIFIPCLFLLISSVLYFSGKKRLSIYFTLLSFGFFTHLILDASLCGYIQPFFPISTFHFGLNLIDKILWVFYPSLVGTDFGLLVYSSMDAILLFLWLIYMQMTGKIKDYF